MTVTVDLSVSLREAGVHVVLDLRGGRLPAVVHWGADLGAFGPEDGGTLSLTGLEPIAANVVDEPVRVALLPEHWTGWVGRPGLSGARRGGGAWSTRFTTTALRIGSQEVAETTGGGLLELSGPVVLEVDAVDEAAELELTLTFEVLTGGVVRTRARLGNRGAAYAVHDVVLAFPVPPVAREVLDFTGHWGKERVPVRRPFQVGTHLREGRKGRTGADAATLLHLGVPGFSFAAGEIWSVHTGWSGNHTHYAERLSTGEQVIGGGELLLPDEVVLETGEAYTTPWVYAAYGVGLDDVARRFHRYQRSRPQHPSTERPVTLNVWEAVYFDHDLPKLVALAEAAAGLGVERYVLDDGWFGARRHDRAGLGDWTVATDVWPDGLHPLVDAVTGLGMQFGLWFEPEMVNLDSDVARAHPDWVMATGGRLPVESRFQQVLNLGIPECYAYVRDAMLAILDEYAISYLKWDHNRDLVDAGTQPSGRPGVHEQTLACYRLMAELKAAHPGLEIESCSSGGSRVDLGVLEHTDRVWVSDCIDPLERQQMHRWTTQLLAPELMGAHIASGRSHTTGREHDLNFRAVTALFGHLGIEWDLTRASAPELAELQRWIELYQQYRGLLLGGDLVRVDFPDPSVVVGGVLAPDRSAALFSVASVARSEVVTLGRVRFPGLDPHRRYRVTPLMLETAPSGLRPPPWWGTGTTDPFLANVAGHGHTALDAAAARGVELSGAALSGLGLAMAQLDPDHALLYLVDAVG
ncbi:MAG: aga [Friedmanniella sp.]|nr:aga [Friedmanniella sp.]